MHLTANKSKRLIFVLGLFVMQAFSQTSTDFPVRYVNGYRPAADSLFNWVNSDWEFKNARIYVYAGDRDLFPVTSTFTSANVQMIQHTYTYNGSGQVLQDQTLDGGYLIELEKCTYTNGMLTRILNTSYNRDFTTHVILDSTQSLDSLFYNGQNQCILHAKYMLDSDKWVRVQTLSYTYAAGCNDTLTETFSQVASLTDLTLLVIKTVTSSYNSDHTVSEKKEEYPAFPTIKPGKVVYTYENNRLASILSYKESSPGTNTISGRTLYIYNTNLQLVRKVIQDSASVNTRVYVYTFDNAGNVLGEIDSTSTGLAGKTTFSYETITSTANKNQVVRTTSMAGPLRFDNSNGNISYMSKWASGLNVNLEIRTVQGTLVAILSPSSISNGIVCFNLQKIIASSGMYIVSVRSGARIHAMAKITICR
jgi:hypothetical protein